MWGTLSRVTVPLPSSSAGQFRQSVQLAKVSYKRPETWDFLFGAIILEAPDSIAATPVNIQIDFDLIVGVGRSSLKLAANQGGTGEGFVRLGWLYTTVGSAIVGQTKWTTAAFSPVLDETAAVPVSARLDYIVAQDLQCSARVSTVAASATLVPTVVEVHSYFAPRCHVRPDWFSEEYPGGEKGGT